MNSNTGSTQQKIGDNSNFMLKIRTFVLGEETPDMFTRITFNILLGIWSILISWNILSVIVIKFSEIIEENKGISVNEILIKKGKQLGFEGVNFIGIIENFYILSIFLFLVILIGLILLYRKSNLYAPFFFGGFLFYLISLIFLVGFQFLIEDVSTFDKILLAFMFVLGLIHYTLMIKEKNDLLDQSGETE
jgi:hypothetical protein